MALTTGQKVAGGAVGMSVGAATLAAVFIPHWESGGRMDTTVRQQKIDPMGVYTVCDGITNLDPDYSWIKPGMTFTQEDCRKAFQKVLPKYVEPLARCLPGYFNMPPHRQVALLSFAYNLGPSRVCDTSIARDLNAGRVADACNAMGRYVRANGKVLQGLKNRRFDPKWGEIAWCLRED